MDDRFRVECVALHLVDRRLPGPRFCARAITPADFQDPQDRQAIQIFFSQHFEQMWTIEEGRRTRAAAFQPQSVLRGCYDDILREEGYFYPRSCEIAQRLYDVSHGTTASPGVLIVVKASQVGEDRPFLGLLKLDPGPSFLVSLDKNPDGTLLLDLAVHHVEMTLPSASERVLKWAVLPHPSRRGIDAKVRDEQGRADTARYFMDFLGVAELATEKEQTYGLLDALPEVVEACHPGLVYQPILQGVLADLEQELVITPEVVVHKVKENGQLPNFKEAAFTASLEEHGAAGLNIPGKALSATKIEYRLSNGITIRGPRAAVESMVKITKREDGSIEFTIQAPSYERKYGG